MDRLFVQNKIYNMHLENRYADLKTLKVFWF